MKPNKEKEYFLCVVLSNSGRPLEYQVSHKSVQQLDEAIKAGRPRLNFIRELRDTQGNLKEVGMRYLLISPDNVFMYWLDEREAVKTSGLILPNFKGEMHS